MSRPSPLSSAEVLHIARLVRLALTEVEVERYRTQLAGILEYVRQISDLDVQNVEPMSHPGACPAVTNRLEQDDPQPPLPLQALEANAPAMEGRLLAVPKVIDAGDGG